MEQLPEPPDFALASELAEIARLEEDGCLGLGKGIMAEPEYVCLIATNLNPSRLAVLQALLNDWYPLNTPGEQDAQ